MHARNSHRAGPFYDEDAEERHERPVHFRLSPKGDPTGRPLCHSQASVKGGCSPHRVKVTCRTCLERLRILDKSMQES